VEKSNTEEIRQVLKFIAKGYKVPKSIYDVVFDVAIREIEEKGKIVLSKRDPNTESGRIQAQFVKIIDGVSISIHPSSVGPYGADFDGDTLAIYAPISEEAQKEARDRMVTATSKTGINKPNFEISKEMLLGLFTLTADPRRKTLPKKIKNIEQAEQENITQLVDMVFKGSKRRTTAGRIIFNNELPKEFEFVDEEITKKVVDNILSKILAKSSDMFGKTINKLMLLGFKYATIEPKTFSLDQMELPDTLIELKQQLGKAKTLSDQMEIEHQMEIELLKHLKKTDNDLYYAVKSGASKGISQLRQVMVAKGVIADPMGNPLPPITDSFNDGYSPQNYFDAASGARKGVIDRALNTAQGGYTYRKMIYILSDVEADLKVKDCGTKSTLNIKLTKPMFNRMPGRYTLNDKGIITKISEKMIGQKIKLRSPVFCRNKKICRTCYGDLIKQITSPNVGIIAAQEVGSLAEKIMKCGVGLINKNKKLISMDDIWEEKDKL